MRKRLFGLGAVRQRPAQKEPNPHFTLRPATARDAKAIRALIWQVGINPTGLNWRRFWVAVSGVGGRVIGCGQVKPHADGTLELASLAVRPEWQRAGVGQAIVKRLLAEHPPPLYLTCRASLQPYYRRFGFAEVEPGEMPPYFRRIWKLFAALRRFFPRRMEGLSVMVCQTRAD